MATKKNQNLETMDTTLESEDTKTSIKMSFDVMNYEIKRRKEIYDNLNSVDVGKYIEYKKDLAYVSWANAYDELFKRYPNSEVEVVTFGENNLPYLYDENLGYMVSVKVTVNGITKQEYLPVMDNNNNAMKNHAYEIFKGKYKSVVQPANMMDINNAIKRCEAKAIALHGLGLYIYAGEDLPKVSEEIKPAPKLQSTPKQTEFVQKEGCISQEQATHLKQICTSQELSQIAKEHGYKSYSSFELETYNQIIAQKNVQPITEIAVQG